jgi:hypothetical protein
MSTDRELLELAAKAADEGIVFYGECLRAQTGREWNPLVDDGDALRLAVKLNIDFRAYGSSVRSLVLDVVRQKVIASFDEIVTDDPYASTRRAIVRAAAQIGKTNQPGEA